MPSLPKFRRVVRISQIFALLAAAQSAQAIPDDYRANVREACRQAISGAYIEAYTERERNRTLIRTLNENLKETDSALTTARAAQKRLKAEAEGRDFELSRAVAIDQSSARVKTLAAQRDDYAALIHRAQADFSTAEGREKSLLAALAKVFTDERSMDRADGGFPIRLDYKSPCPKYRALCPLPVDDAKALAAIPIEGGSPEACRRYASQSKLR
jgi:hypothetical protein